MHTTYNLATFGPRSDMNDTAMLQLSNVHELRVVTIRLGFFLLFFVFGSRRLIVAFHNQCLVWYRAKPGLRRGVG